MRIVDAAWRGLRWTLAASGGFFLPDETSRRTVKSCGPGAATLASIRPASAGLATGATKAVPRGEREVSRQTLRGESRDVLAVPVKAVCVSCYPLHMAMRAQSAPGFPCALCWEGATNWHHPRTKNESRE